MRKDCRSTAEAEPRTASRQRRARERAMLSPTPSGTAPTDSREGVRGQWVADDATAACPAAQDFGSQICPCFECCAQRRPRPDYVWVCVPTLFSPQPQLWGVLPLSIRYPEPAALPHAGTSPATQRLTNPELSTTKRLRTSTNIHFRCVSCRRRPSPLWRPLFGTLSERLQPSRRRGRQPTNAAAACV